ncbi:protein farnesyltransferase/ geranylgeranyltransferase type-1 subunit alpha [Phtheirospermum japonicum]|uniref:Protein farnesyltransferase/geranylgeranyltransferase type-1 subunit alpha n=1 Tax=Phtheirospermum japonicum TaxID=374723 RepID=A0A830BZD1_9LAMI|nr:protein farnesyltransferase/ geranylgeranyltransferase type-1 subunit alpha [Phtheirospermum japonicum]
MKHRHRRRRRDFCKGKSDIEEAEAPGQRWVVEKIGPEAASKELEFTEKILAEKGTKNYQAWSHREWVIQQFDIRSLWLSELQYCRRVLEKDKFNVYAWDHICRAARYSELNNESRLSEAIYAKEAIRSQAGNEGPWTYLKVLYARDKKSLYTNPDLECIYVDVLSDEVDRLKLAKELDPDYDVACASMDKRGCVHALNLVVDLVILAGYKVINNPRLVEAVKFFFAYSRPDFPRVDPYRLWSMDEKGIFGIVCAAAFSLDACRIRYCYMYHGFYWFRDRHIYLEKKGKSPFELEEMYNTTSCDDSSPQLAERLGFESFITSLCQPVVDFNDIFSLHLEWKECLFQSYLQKRRRPGNDDTTLEEDLKWDLRRCVVKDKGTNAAALEEIKFTTKIINEDAYNRCAWSHRQWVFQTFGGDWEDEDELEFCDVILKKDACNSFAWDQRYFVITRWVPKILAAKEPDMFEGDGVYEKVLELEVSFKNKKTQEADYAIEFIDAEPGNQLPWSHIIGLYTAYPGLFWQNVKVRDAIMRVLEGARLCALGLDLSDGIMGGGGSRFVINARGITNALNMLLDIIINHDPYFDTREECKKFSRVMDELCPDSCIPQDPARNFKYDILDKSTFILRQMDTYLPYAGLSWQNATDQLIDGGGL